MVDGDFTLWESNAIMQYIASKTATPLWPNDARSRADITRWQCWELAHWGAQACGPLTFENLVKKFVNLGAPDQTAVAKATEAFNKEAKVLDAHLAKHKYLVGDVLTLADFTVAAPLFHAQGAGMPVAPYANVRELVRARRRRCRAGARPHRKCPRRRRKRRGQVSVMSRALPGHLRSSNSIQSQINPGCAALKAGA